MAIPYIFVSYSHADAKFAMALADRMKAAKIPHFRDLESIDWGEDIPDRIHQALERATHLVVLISPGSEKSQWVAYEMGYARGRHVTLVPYLLHPSMVLPGFIQSKRYLRDATDERRFLASLAKLVRLETPQHGEVSKRAGQIQSALRMLRNKNSKVREDAANALVRAKAGVELLSMLSHHDVNVREAAAIGCSRLSYMPALPYLVAGMHRLGARGNRQVVPGVEKLFAPFGVDAVAALLADTPRESNESERWLSALSSVLTSRSAHDVLRVAKQTPAKWNLLPLLRKTNGVSAEDIVSLLQRHFDKSFWRVWELKEFFDALKSTKYGKYAAIRKWIKTSAIAAIREVGPTTNWQVDNVVGVVEVARQMKVIDQEEIESAAYRTKNVRLQTILSGLPT
jgi:hypothetical protein